MIAHAGQDHVVGEMTVGPEYRSADGKVRSPALFALAEELVGIGASMVEPEGRATAMLETKASHFRPCAAPVIQGHATALHLGPTTMVWQTTLTDPLGVSIAVITHTLLVVAPQPVAAENAPLNPAQLQPGNIALITPLQRSAPGRGARADETKSDKRRGHIGEAACSVISRKGFAGATIREIADAAGLHVPTLYQYVESKDEVLELAFGWLIDQVSMDIEAATAGGTTAREKLHAAVSKLIRRSNSYRWQIGLLNRELKSLSPKARLRVFGEFQTLLGRLASLVEDGVVSGEFRAVQPVIVANFLDAVVDVWALRQYSVAQFGMEAFEQETIRFMDAALLPRSS